MDEKLIDYVKESLTRGLQREKIEKSLLDIGWEKEYVDEAFNQLDEKQSSGSTADKMRPQPNIPLETEQSTASPPLGSNQKIKKFLKIGIITLILLLLVGVGAYLWKSGRLQGIRIGTNEPQEAGLGKQIEFEEIEITGLPESINEMVWVQNGKKVVLLNVAGGKPQIASVGLVDLEKYTYRESYRRENDYIEDLSKNQEGNLFLFSHGLLSLDSGQVNVIKQFEEPKKIWRPKLSPNGQYIAYVDDNTGFIIRSDNEEKISELPSFMTGYDDFMWMPDSTFLIYPMYEENTSAPEPACGIYKINIFTKEKIKLFSLAFPSGYDDELSFKVSPDGKKILFVSPSDVPGRHLWIYDLEMREKILLSNNEGEDIEAFTWAEDSTGVVALRHLFIENDYHVVVFPSLSAEKSKIFPLNDDFFSTEYSFFEEKGNLWLSAKSKEIRFLLYDWQNGKYKFITADIQKLYDQAEFFRFKTDEKNKTVLYTSDAAGVAFKYPANWGKVLEETTEYYTCFRFSQLYGYSQLRVTSLEKIRNYFDGLGTKSPDEIDELFNKRGEEIDQGKSVCGVFGPMGALNSLYFSSAAHRDITQLFPSPLPRETEVYELKYLALIDTNNFDSEAIRDTSYTLASSLFADGMLGIREPARPIINEEGSLIGTTFYLEEGWDTGSTSFLESIYTLPIRNEQIVVLKIPLHEASSYTFGHDGAERINEVIKSNLAKEKKVVEDSLHFLKKEEILSLNPEKRAILQRDLKKKVDLYALVDGLSWYNQVQKGYPVTPNEEQITRNTIKSSQFYRAFQEANIHWDHQLREGVSYGYYSDGTSYELSVTLENRDDVECTVEETSCIFRIRNGEVVSKR